MKKQVLIFLMIIGTMLPLFAKSKGLKTKEDYLKAKMFNKNDVAFINKGNNGSTYTEYYQTSLYWDENKNVSLHIYKCNWNGYNYEVCYWSNNWKDSVRKKGLFW